MFSPDLGCGAARAEDVSVKVRGDFLPLREVNRVYELVSEVVKTEPPPTMVAAVDMEEDGTFGQNKEEQDASEGKVPVVKPQNYELMRHDELKELLEMRGIDHDSDVKADMVRQLRRADADELDLGKVAEKAGNVSGDAVFKNKLAKVPDGPSGEEKRRH